MRASHRSGRGLRRLYSGLRRQRALPPWQWAPVLYRPRWVVPHIQKAIHWHSLRRIVSRTGHIVSINIIVALGINPPIDRAHLGTLPDVARMLCVLLNTGKNACGNDPMGLAEVLVDLCGQIRESVSCRMFCLPWPYLEA